MREFALVRPTFWIGRTGRWLRTQDSVVTNVALYLITCPSSEMSGLYYITIQAIAHGIGASETDTLKALKALSDEGFLMYDFDSEAVFIVNMARYQLGEYLNPGDKRISGLKKALPAMSGSELYDIFLDEYGEVYHLEGLRNRSPISPIRPLSPSCKDKDKDKEKEKEKEKTETRVRRACVFPPALASENFRQAWDRWGQFRKETKHKLTPSTEEKQLKKLAAWGEAQAIASIEQSIEQGWQGLFEPRANGKPKVAKRDEHRIIGSYEEEDMADAPF